MMKYRLFAGLLIVLLCLASGLVLAQDATSEPDPLAVCVEGEAAPCIAAPYLLAADEGEAIWFGGALDTIKASGAQTGGLMSVVEVLFPPGGGTPLHLFHTQDQGVYILEGSMRGVMGDHQFSATAGAFVWFPRGIPSGFVADGDQMLRILVMSVPAGFDSFVREAGEPAQELTVPPPSELDVARLTAIAAKYQQDILGPLVLEP